MTCTTTHHLACSCREDYVKRLEDALRFYAEGKQYEWFNYGNDLVYVSVNNPVENGGKARQALGIEEK